MEARGRGRTEENGIQNTASIICILEGSMLLSLHINLLVFFAAADGDDCLLGVSCLLCRRYSKGPRGR